jgi:hypothetical protein
MRSFFFYFMFPVVGVFVLEPGPFPLLPLFMAPPGLVFVPVVPIFFCIAASPDGLPVGPVASPFVVPVGAGALDVEPPVEFCANANVLVSANAVAIATILSFMVASSSFCCPE